MSKKILAVAAVTVRTLLLRPTFIALTVSCIAAVAAFPANRAMASTAYGDLNNFDVFNDTGSDCHGFEIELDDIHSTDITYTYDYNHYGAPTITEDNADPAHPKVFVRYAAKYNSATNSFSAYTAVPATPPAATDGHQCTNPTVNFGCEHFGVGHYGAPTVVRYNWLIENPSAPGTLIHGPAVNVATPSWTYYPPAPAQVAQVQAVILAPPPPPAPVYEFGDAVWVKSIVTTSHNNQPVELRDLVSDDPDDPSDENWTNGEPDEVEVEWRIMQTEFNNPDGANNELAGENEDLPNGDEVVTRRYEFYKYTGPLDPETNEAKCDNYPQISDPNDPQYKPECDPQTVTVLGDYIGAQMAGFDVESPLGLVDHVQDGDLNELYTTRTVVIGGNTPYVTSVMPGSLPPGLNIDSPTGVLSGTPTAAGEFSFTITATDADTVQVTKAYTMTVNDQADACPDDPAKTEPGVCGCGVPDDDTDGDGTPDCNDLCPADAGKTDPGVCGCAVADSDTDGDGTPDCNDLCPTDGGKTDPGVCGCGTADVDTDGDGTPDCNDLCPADGGKTDPGVCGCGVADVDTDGDGTPDCNDLCPADGGKTDPGVCGCGVADVDTDGDGTLDCNDQCPADPGKTAPGACGCGVADTDGNGNGIADCLEQGADLSLKFKSPPQEGSVGKGIAYTLMVENQGPDSATAVSTHFVCSGVPYDIVKQSKGCVVSENGAADSPSATCSDEVLGNGKSVTNRVKIAPRAAGVLMCAATVSSATPDPDGSDQSQIVTTLVH